MPRSNSLKGDLKGYYKPVIYLLLLMILIVAIASEMKAQDGSTSTSASQQSSSTQPAYVPKSSSTYSNAIGVRAGGSSGLTFKTFINSSNALEFILWGNYSSLGVTGLYEFYVPAFNAAGLNWYYGVGAHARYQSRDIFWARERVIIEDRMALGVDGIAGIEYKINPIPVAISLDVKPFVEVWTDGGARLGIDPGLGVKFAF